MAIRTFSSAWTAKSRGDDFLGRYNPLLLRVPLRYDSYFFPSSMVKRCFEVRVGRRVFFPVFFRGFRNTSASGTPVPF